MIKHIVIGIDILKKLQKDLDNETNKKKVLKFYKKNKTEVIISWCSTSGHNEVI